MPKAQHFLRFRVNGQWYGIPVENIIEVLQMLALSELPAAAPDVLGLMTVRDLVMPVIDLRRRFGRPDAPLRLDTPIIAVRVGKRPVGLVVDDADDVKRIEDSQIVPREGSESPYVIATARIDEKLLLLLDLNLISAAA